MNKSILIIDDCPNFHKLVRAYLAAEPIDVHSAFEGAMGIVLAEKFSPGVILLDLDMPVLDGFEVCRQLKKNPLTRSCPIVFLTAEVSPSQQVKGLELGANDFMTKRFKPDELRTRIRAVLGMSASLRQAA